MGPPESTLTSPASAAYAGRTVLVTGGLGFIGLNLVRSLVAAGAAVRVLSRSWSPRDPEVESVLESVALHKGDIRDEAVVRSSVRGSSVIFHCAGKSGPSASNRSPLEDLDVNVRGQLMLLEACRELNPSVRIVFPSSRLVYSAGSALPVAEDAPTVPASVYGVHKLAAERHLLLYRRLYGLQATVLRITNPYGPFQRAEQSGYGVINWFIHRALHGEQLSVYGAGDQLRDYVHIDDVVEAMLLAGLTAEADGAVLNVASGKGVTFRQMAELVVATTGAGTVVEVPWPDDARRVETGNFVADIARARQVLGWTPRTAFGDGVTAVVDRYRATSPL